MSIVDQRRPSLKPCSDCWGCSGSCSWHISVLHSWLPKTYTPNTHRTGLPNTDTPRSPEQHPPRSCWEGWPWVFEPRAGRLDGGTACTGTSNQTSHLNHTGPSTTGLRFHPNISSRSCLTATRGICRPSCGSPTWCLDWRHSSWTTREWSQLSIAACLFLMFYLLHGHKVTSVPIGK